MVLTSRYTSINLRVTTGWVETQCILYCDYIRTVLGWSRAVAIIEMGTGASFGNDNAAHVSVTNSRTELVLSSIFLNDLNCAKARAVQLWITHLNFISFRIPKVYFSVVFRGSQSWFTTTVQYQFSWTAVIHSSCKLHMQTPSAIDRDHHRSLFISSLEFRSPTRWTLRQHS